MNFLIKIRLIMFFLFCSTSSFLYWMQVANRINRSNRLVSTEGHMQRQILSVDHEIRRRLQELQRKPGVGFPSNYSENVSNSNFVRPRFNFLKQPGRVYRADCHGFTCVQLKRNVTWTMVNFIKSKADHYEHRKDIRTTWGRRTLVNNTRFETIFVVGTTTNKTTEAYLKKEHRKFGDILQLEGPDEYKYVPLKTLAGMQWASDNLPSQYFYSSGDDDVMIMLDRFKRVIDYYDNITKSENWPEFPIVCTYRTMELARPYRNLTGRYKQWFISKQEYKWPFFPRGCFGGFYSTSMSVVKKLTDIASTTPYLRVDDVWITGILRSKMGMPDYMVIKPREKIAFHGVGNKLSKVGEKILRKEMELHKNETRVDRHEVVPLRADPNVETS